MSEPETETGLVLFQESAVERVRVGINGWLDSDDIALFVAEVDEAVQTAAPMTEVTSDDSYTIVVDHWKALKELRKRIEAHFAQPKAALHSFHKLVSGAESEYVNQVKAEADRLNTIASAWAKKKEDLRKAAQAAADREHAAQQEKAASDAAAQAEAAGASPAEVAAARTAVEQTPAPQVQSSTPAGPKRQSSWKAQITDIAAFCDAIALDHAENNPNEPRFPLPTIIMGIRLDAKGQPTNTYLNDQARKTGGKFTMPGVRVFDDGKLR